MIRAFNAIVFSLLFSACYMLSSDLENGISSFRGGDIVVTHAQPIKGDALLFAIDSGVEDLNKRMDEQEIPSEMKETEVASMISHVMGSTPISGYVPKQVKSFPSSTVLHKPSANILVSIADVGEINSAQLGMSRIQNMRQQYPNYLVSSTFEPRNLISQITTLSTGELPSVHGVMGEQWVEDKSTISHDAKNSEAFVPTYGDILAINFPGSLVVGLSASAKLAAAGHVHQGRENSHLFFVNSETKSVQQSSNDEEKAAAQLTSDSLASFISKTGANSIFENFVREGKLTVSGSKLIVELDDAQEAIQFDIENKADAIFLGELLAIDTLLTELKSGSLSQFVADGTPDSFSLTLSGFKEILSENGASARKTVASAQLLDAVVPKVLSLFSQLYHSETTAELLLLGSPSRVSDMKKEILDNLQDNLRSSVDAKSTYPTIYVEENLSRAALQALCSRVHSVVSKQGLKASCIREFTTPGYLQQKASMKDSSSNTSSNVTADDIANFQINLWVSFSFVLIVLAAIYPLAYGDFTSGPFSSFLYAKKYI